MRAETSRGEERSLEVNPEDARSVAVEGNLGDRAEELLLGRRDEGREVGGDAGLEQGVACPAVTGRVGVHEVDAAEPVHLKIDEPRRRDAASVPARDSDPRVAAVEDLDVARDEPAVDERGFDPELHPTASLTSPAAAPTCSAALITIVGFSLVVGFLAGLALTKFRFHGRCALVLR
jgi:hypothetical protein